MSRTTFVAVVFLLASAVVQAAQCSRDGECPSAALQNGMSLIQTKLQTNVIKDVEKPAKAKVEEAHAMESLVTKSGAMKGMEFTMVQGKLTASAGHVSGIVHNSPSPQPSPSSKPCRADIDCNIGESTSWRCQHDPKQKSSADSNCHLPGPFTQGNATCGCGTPICAKGSTRPETKSARQYLMIGDSISYGMEANVAAELSPRGIELVHNPGNAASTNWGAHCLDDWLQTKPPGERVWDVISFQFGGHDLAFDTERISAEQYKMLLTNITSTLAQEQKQHGTKLIWVTTTPVPTVPTYGPSCMSTTSCLNPPRFDADVVLYNSIAAEVMNSAMQMGVEIATLDLYSFVLKRCGGKGYATCDGFQLPMNEHYTSSGWVSLGHQMASAVLASLG